jgi:hypothetical protein
MSGKLAGFQCSLTAFQMFLWKAQAQSLSWEPPGSDTLSLCLFLSLSLSLGLCGNPAVLSLRALIFSGNSGFGVDQGQQVAKA